MRAFPAYIMAATLYIVPRHMATKSTPPKAEPKAAAKPAPKPVPKSGKTYNTTLVSKAQGSAPPKKTLRSADARIKTRAGKPKSKDPVKGLQGPRTSLGQIAAGPDDPKYTDISPLVITAYLAALAVDGRPTKVARELRIHYMSIAALRKEDPAFLEAYSAAMSQAFEHHEDEVRRRAFEGYQRPVFQQGMLVGHITEYSDRLAEMMIRAGKPEIYNPKTIQVLEHSGSIGTKISQMTDEELNEEINKKLRLLGALPTTPQEIARNLRDAEGNADA